MHIAINGWFWHQAHTGSGQYARRLVHSLSALQRDVKLTVLLSSDHPAKKENLGSNVSLVHHPTREGALSKLWWEQVTVPRLASRLGADLLHVPYWAPPLSTAIPTVVTIHDLIPLLLPAYRGNALVRLYTSFVKATSPIADLIVTDSYAARNDIITHLSIDPTRLRVVHLAADPTYSPNPAPDDAEIRNRWQISQPYLLYLGGFDIRKNLETAIQAFAKVSDAVESATFVVAGKLPNSDSGLFSDPRKQIAPTGIAPGRVKFLGYVAEETKPALYRGARTFVYPSIYEGFGLPPLEALACGLPVVGSDRSSLPEVVGQAGILLAPDDVDGIAGAIIQLLIDDRVFETLKQEATKQAARFSWEATARETWNAYRAVLA